MTQYADLTMTVAELIEKLKKLPQDYIVGNGTDGEHFHPDNMIAFDDTKEVLL